MIILIVNVVSDSLLFYTLKMDLPTCYINIFCNPVVSFTKVTTEHVYRVKTGVTINIIAEDESNFRAIIALINILCNVLNIKNAVKEILFNKFLINMTFH